LPNSLDDLVPAYLAQIPADPFGDGPLKAVRTDRALAIYSVGPDGVDDGGKPFSDRFKFAFPDSKGDIVIQVAPR